MNNKQQVKEALESLRRMHDELECYMRDAGDQDLYNDTDYQTILTALENPTDTQELIEELEGMKREICQIKNTSGYIENIGHNTAIDQIINKLRGE